MRNTNFSRTLQEDASCQMLTVLRRYLHMMGTDSVELAVISDTIPQLITIQKGILALTRQWKNVLYMPQLSKINFKTQKHRPYTVTFKVPTNDTDDDEGASVNMNMDLIDDRVSLLDGASYRDADTVSMVSAQGVPETRKRQGDSRFLQIQKALFNSPKRQETNPHMTSLLRNESVQSMHSMGGASMIEDVVVPTPPATPYKVNKFHMINNV